MTSTSFNARQSGYRQSASDQTHAEAQEPTCDKAPAQILHAYETQRMKDFAGQRRFQAPVADDFARGMLAPGQELGRDAQPLASLRGVMVSVMIGLRSMCSGQKAENNRAAPPHDRD